MESESLDWEAGIFRRQYGNMSAPQGASRTRSPSRRRRRLAHKWRATSRVRVPGVVQADIGRQFLETSVLLLKFLQPFRLLDPHPAVLLSPTVVGLLRHPDLATCLPNRLALAQKYLGLPGLSMNCSGVYAFLGMPTYLFLSPKSNTSPGLIHRWLLKNPFDHPPDPLPSQEGGRDCIWGTPPDPCQSQRLSEEAAPLWTPLFHRPASEAGGFTEFHRSHS